MKEIADGVWRLPVRANVVNVFVVGDVLIDAGMPWDAGWLLGQLAGRDIAAHAITHAHPDHMGGSPAITRELGIPFWCGAADVPAAEDPAAMTGDFLRLPFGGPSLPRNPLTDRGFRAASGGGVSVARALGEGDDVGGFTVLDTPGHTRGHIALWRAADRVLIGGDACWNLEYVRGRPGLVPPAGPANVDNAAVRDSIRKLAALEPAVAAFGHGPVVAGPGRLSRLADSLK